MMGPAIFSQQNQEAIKKGLDFHLNPYLVPTCHVGIQGGRASVPLQSRSDMRGRELNEEDFMGRSRYIIYEHQVPHFLTCTFNN